MAISLNRLPVTEADVRVINGELVALHGSGRKTTPIEIALDGADVAIDNAGFAVLGGTTAQEVFESVDFQLDNLGGAFPLDSEEWGTWYDNATGSTELNIIRTDSSDNTVLNAIDTKEIQLSVNEATQWTLDSNGNLIPEAGNELGSTSKPLSKLTGNTLSSPTGDVGTLAGPGHIQLIGAEGKITQSTADGADNRSLILNGGGDATYIDVTRGAVLALYGNEHPGEQGRALIASSRAVEFFTGPSATKRWILDQNGHLVSASSTAYNLGSPSSLVGTVYAVNLQGQNGTITNDLIVEGNLIVSGTQTILNTEELQIEDNIITLNSTHTGVPALDAGIEINRGSEPYARLFWDESEDYFVVGASGSELRILTENHPDPITLGNTLKLPNDVSLLSSTVSGVEVELLKTTNTDDTFLRAEAGRLLLQSDVNDIQFLTGSPQTVQWKINSDGQLLAASGSAAFIGIDTGSGDDSEYLTIAASNGVALTRTAFIRVYGDEHADTDLRGSLVLGTASEGSGNQTGRNIYFQNSQFTTQRFVMNTNNGTLTVDGYTSAGLDATASNAEIRLGASNNSSGGGVKTYNVNHSTNPGKVMLIGGRGNQPNRDVEFHTGNFSASQRRWFIPRDLSTSGSQFLFDQPNAAIHANTQAGSDSFKLTLGAFGRDTELPADESRGACIELHGKDHPTNPDELILKGGTTTGKISVHSNIQASASGTLDIGTASEPFANLHVDTLHVTSLSGIELESIVHPNEDWEQWYDNTGSGVLDVISVDSSNNVIIKNSDETPVVTRMLFNDGNETFGSSRYIDYYLNGFTNYINSNSPLTVLGAAQLSLGIVNGPGGGQILIPSNGNIDISTSHATGQIRILEDYLHIGALGGSQPRWTFNQNRLRARQAGIISAEIDNTSAMYFAGGYDNTDSDGAYIAAFGNENAASTSGTLQLHAGDNGTGTVEVHTNGAHQWTFTERAGSQAALRFVNGNVGAIYASTDDSADTGLLALCGGGDLIDSRGALSYLYGNESGGAGNHVLYHGNVANARVTFGGINGAFGFRQSGLMEMYMSSPSSQPQIRFRATGTESGYLDITGGTNASTSLGSFVMFRGNDNAILGGSQAGQLRLGAGDAEIVFITDPNTERWHMTQPGHFVPQASGTYDIGSAALPVRDIYAQSITTSASPGVKLSSDGSRGILDSSENNDLRIQRNGVPFIQLEDGHVIFTQPVTMESDLNVSGTNNILNTEQLLIEDNIITLNSTASGIPSLDSGFEVNRGSEAYAQLLWDESEDHFIAGISGSLEKVMLASDSPTDMSAIPNNTALQFNSTSGTVDVLQIDSSNRVVLTAEDNVDTIRFMVSPGGNRYIDHVFDDGTFINTYTPANWNIQGNTVQLRNGTGDAALDLAGSSVFMSGTTVETRGSTSSSLLRIRQGSGNRWNFSTNALTYQFAAALFSEASENISFTVGGGTSAANGAHLEVFGDAHATYGGQAHLTSSSGIVLTPADTKELEVRFDGGTFVELNSNVNLAIRANATTLRLYGGNTNESYIELVENSDVLISARDDIRFIADDRMEYSTNGVVQFYMENGAILPQSSGTKTLGSASLPFDTLYTEVVNAGDSTLERGQLLIEATAREAFIGTNGPSGSLEDMITICPRPGTTHASSSYIQVGGIGALQTGITHHTGNEIRFEASGASHHYLRIQNGVSFFRMQGTAGAAITFDSGTNKGTMIAGGPTFDSLTPITTQAASLLVFGSTHATEPGNAKLASANGGQIKLNIGGTDTWFIENDGDFVPQTSGTLDIGSATNTVGTLYVDNIVGVDLGSGGPDYQEETGTSATLAVNTEYSANNASLVTLTLPATATAGDKIRVIAKGAGGFRIAQNAGQVIHHGSNPTTSGAGGYIESTNQYDVLELQCITDDTVFAVVSSIGNFNTN